MAGLNWAQIEKPFFFYIIELIEHHDYNLIPTPSGAMPKHSPFNNASYALLNMYSLYS